MFDLKIPVDHNRALALYYQKYMGCRFYLNGEECAANEVFHQSGFLPLIVEEANKMSLSAFNQPINVELIDQPDTLLGKTVVLAEDFRQPVVFMLLRAADTVFEAKEGMSIELLPLFTYYRKPLHQRGRAPWRPSPF